MLVFTVFFYGRAVKQSKTVKTWTRTSVQNLVRHKSGRYYARLFGNGKETWKSLKTDILEVAKVKLHDLAGDVENVAKANAAHERGRMTVGDCAVIFGDRLKEGFGLRGRGKTLRRISASSVHYREQTLTALFATWPNLESTDVRKVSHQDAEQWARRFSKDYSPSRYNNTLDTLRALLDIAVKSGGRHGNPAREVGRVGVNAKALVLPEREQFKAFVAAIRGSTSRLADDCADFVEFLAYTGARKDEASNVLWSDVDFGRGQIHLRKTKGGRPRFVPMIAESRQLLERIRAERPSEASECRVLCVTEARGAIDTAVEKIGMTRITHHDLRHLFATVCIEAGVDIPTVSRWLGHRDGGALAMRTYGHLRDEHSAASAKKVTFSPLPRPTNVLEFGAAAAIG